MSPLKWNTTLLCLVIMAMAGCAEDMDQQVSYQPMEEPRLHSPDGSVPRHSRSAITAPPTMSSALVERGSEIYRINCAHCHGPEGTGGSGAGFLIRTPTDLRAPHVKVKPDIALYAIITEGMGAMPRFKGLLTVQERWAVVYHLKNRQQTLNEQ